jgi:hypothetical protein
MLSGLVPIAAALCSAPSYAAELKLPPTSVGAGLRTSFVNTSSDASDQDVSDFVLDSVRLYLGGAVTDTIKFTFNTDYNSTDSSVTVIDAIGRFEFSPKFNIWAGRFLPPSDRANLNGPYYSNEWGFATEGVQDGFPFYAAGRDNGVAYWGDFSRFKVSVGAFDVPSTAGNNDLVYAARFQVDLWDLEPGYYLNGTYYGDKDILAFGLAGQAVNGDSALTFDALMEKKFGGGGVLSLEGEYANYDGFGGYGSPVPFTSSDGFFGLAAFLFPAEIGIGKFQVLGKLANTSYDTAGPDVERTTVEANLNYIIKAFNARLSLFVIDTSFDEVDGFDSTQVGLGLQVQI